MLNKYLFGLLVNTIAIFASISSDVVAYGDIRKCRSELNQIAWNMDCSCREFVIGRDRITESNTFKNYHWILDQEYEESRTKVIGEAIGDCVAGKGVFADRNAEDIITFDETEPKDYEPEHWNAVILYNYIHEAINGEGLPDYQKSKEEAKNLLNDENEYTKYVKDVQNILNSKYKGKSKIEMIRDYYKDYYKTHCPKTADELIQRLPEKLGLAIQEIQEYVNALRLHMRLFNFRQSKQEYDANQDIKDIAPYVHELYSDDQNLYLDRGFCKFNNESPDKRLRYYPAFKYYEDKLYIAQIDTQEQYWKANPNGGRGSWTQNKFSSCVKDIPTYDNIDKPNEKDDPNLIWLLKRLQGLVNIPTPKQWMNWNHWRIYGTY